VSGTALAAGARWRKSAAIGAGETGVYPNFPTRATKCDSVAFFVNLF
jgi:hypothetical protein